MDVRLENALSQANYKAALATQKENTKLRYANALVFATNGGLFSSSPSLISFVDLLINKGETDAILIDDRGNPIMIADLKAFQDGLLTTYHEATNEYYTEFEKLKKARNVKAVAGV
jgi:hypothetical protein